MNSSVVNSNIYQFQRYYDKCGRENKIINKGTLCAGAINGIHCSNVIYPRVKFCIGCDTGNSAYVSGSNSEDDLTSSTSLYREEKVNQEEKWEPTNKAYDTMNSSEVIRCQYCNSNINQCQRYCDKCGRENKSIDKGTLCTGTINGIHCSNVINPRVKFCSGCGTENSAYVSGSNSEDDLTSSTSLYREEKVNQEEKWEPTNKAYDSATRVGEDTDHENISDLQDMENDAELNDIYAELKKEGKMETSTYTRKKLAEAKTMNLKFAVIGRSAVGKSSFINMMLDLQPGNTYYGEPGARDTTKNAYAYEHPQNENITFFDMPGFGTMEMTIEKFLSMFSSDLNTFDYFFIFIDTVIMEGDLRLVEKIKGYGTPYCFMRSKLDEDIKKGRTKEEIRQKLERSIQANSTVKGSALFLISNEKSYLHTGDFRELFSHITKHFPLVKAESLSFFLPILTPEMIERKFKALAKRIKYVAFTASFISGILNHSLDNSVNIWICGKEIEEYYRVFLLDKGMVLHVQGVKHRKFSKNDIKQYVTTFFNEKTNVEHFATVPKNIMSHSAFMLSGYMSISAGATVYKYARQLLIQTLMEMTADAHTVYEHYTKFK